jgi:hypothetical protein
MYGAYEADMTQGPLAWPAAKCLLQSLDYPNNIVLSGDRAQSSSVFEQLWLTSSKIGLYPMTICTGQKVYR